jgi:hypothetical protein
MAVAVGLFLTSLGLMAWNGSSESRQKGPFAQKCDSLLWTVKGWFGLNPKPVMLGEIMVAPAPPSTPTSGTPSSQTAAP